MIPVFLTLRVQWFRLWIPLVIVWILLLPLILLLLPITLLACLIIQVNVLRAMRIFWELFTGLSGTKIDIADGKHVVAVRIY